jgi:hypothetical protein
MIPPDDVLVQTRKRYEGAEARINQNLQEIKDGHSALSIEEPSRVIARLERLGANPTQARAIINGQPVKSVSGLDEISKIAIERVLGKDDLTSISFESGLACRKSRSSSGHQEQFRTDSWLWDWFSDLQSALDHQPPCL